MAARCRARPQPTQAPIIIIASPLPQGNPPTAVPQPTAAGQAQPTQAASQAAAPTQAASGPAPTVPAGSASKGTVTFAFDAFPTYYPGIIMDVKGLLKQRGYDLKLVPFGLDGGGTIGRGALGQAQERRVGCAGDHARWPCASSPTRASARSRP